MGLFIYLLFFSIGVYPLAQVGQEFTVFLNKSDRDHKRVVFKFFAFIFFDMLSCNKELSLSYQQGRLNVIKCNSY